MLVVQIAGGLLLLVIVWRLSLLGRGSHGSVGLVDGKLRPCPASPNCVCSLDEDAQHRIAPLSFEGSAAEAWVRLRHLVEKAMGGRVVSHDDRYLHVEFTTLLMRFVDDVEFQLDEAAHVIHVRSASRVGYSDLGVNRQRVETIRQLLANAKR